jgi:hypothetical protein
MIELTDAELLKKLNDEKPPKLMLETRGALLPEHSEAVSVTYE